MNEQKWQWLRRFGVAVFFVVAVIALYFAALPPVIYFLFRIEAIKMSGETPIVDFIIIPADELHENWKPYKDYANWWAKLMGLNL